jgi:hypothetical protein
MGPYALPVRTVPADTSGLVWFITGAGSRHYVCVVGAAPLQRHPTVLNLQPGRGLNAEVIPPIQ